MLYIKIPEGLEYQQKEINGVKTDVLVDKSGKSTDLPLQEWVKDYLRDKNNLQYQEREGVHFFLKKPPSESRSFLEYLPENNGKNASKSVKLVNGYSVILSKHETNPAFQTTYSGFWYKELPLREEKEQEIIKHQKDVKGARLKAPDSPLGVKIN